MDPNTLESIVRFHGHFCPGLTIGIRAAELVLQELGGHAADEELVALVETDMCGVDAIQYLTGCTFGKGNLIHLDHGKIVFTFIRRADSKALRIAMKSQPPTANPPAGGLAQSGGESPAVTHSDFALPIDIQLVNPERSLAMLNQPLHQLFNIQEVTPRIPEKAKVRTSFPCDSCGESVMETRLRLLNGQRLCLPCFQEKARQL